VATRYITAKTSRLYKNDSDQTCEMVLIFGDEVSVTSQVSNGRVKTKFRDREGWMKEKDLGQEPSLEIYFIDVGQGDSTFIVTPGRKTILIDGGINRRALGFLAWKYRLDQPGTSVTLDLVVSSHADGDHLNGLVPVLTHPRIKVERIVHSGIATYAKDSGFDTRLGNRDAAGLLETRHSAIADLTGVKLSEEFSAWVSAIGKANPSPRYEAVHAGTGPLDIGDTSISLEVLGPLLDQTGATPRLPWFGGKDETSYTINGHSVVLRLKYQEVVALFAGDLNADSSEYLMGDQGIAQKLGAHVFKAPHHGSHDFSPLFLSAIRPQISVVSSGDEPDYGHPRAAFLGAVGRASRSERPLLFSTEIAATFGEVGPVSGGNVNLNELDFGDAGSNAIARWLFKRRLHGMINVRTDGHQLYAARRIAAGSWWESEGPWAPAQ
jgi:competence protein ComEC